MQVSAREAWFNRTRMSAILMMALTVGLSGCEPSVEENTVTLQITGVTDADLRDQIVDRLPELVEGSNHSLSSSWAGDTLTVELSQIEDIEGFARRIDFGDARVAETGTIEVEVSAGKSADVAAENTAPKTPPEPEAKPTPLPPYDAEQVAQDLREAGARQVRVEDGKLSYVNFFRSKSPVTDETLKLLIDEHGRAPEHLTGLSLYGANITDTGLQIISQIPSLETLNLNNVSGSMTNQGLVSMVESLPHLRVLGLSDSPITNDGLASIATLKDLNQLVLDRTNIGDEGLSHLKHLKNLETLKMLGTQVTDDGLVHLTALAKLKRLTLQRTNITGAGAIEHLKKLTKLENLTVPRENFEDEHYEALKAAIPKLWK